MNRRGFMKNAAAAAFGASLAHIASAAPAVGGDVVCGWRLLGRQAGLRASARVSPGG